jgi:cellulose synthase/poly-beta-1,6-N-acetylglucosamine synthase-like glycosyltransferase
MLMEAGVVSLTSVALSRPEGRQSLDPLISIVIPCYDEEDALHALHRSLTRAFASRRDFRYQLVFVDDGSKDATAEILRDLAPGMGAPRLLRSAAISVSNMPSPQACSTLRAMR